MEDKSTNGLAMYHPPRCRTSKEQLKREIETISNNAVIDGVLTNTASFLAVLNMNRQILTMNTEFLDMLGVDNIDDVFGLRPGEVINCIHANEAEGGCGNSEFCPSCGAAIALSLVQSTKKPQERICIAELRSNGEVEDAYFRIKANPILHQDSWYILLFLQDYTQNQKRAILERMFYHDINNTLTGLIGSADILDTLNKDNPFENGLLKSVLDSAVEISRELTLHRALYDNKLAKDYPLSREHLTVDVIFDKIESIFANHPTCKDKTLVIGDALEFNLIADRSVVIKILNNMLKNAFEASEPGDTIKLWSEFDADSAMIQIKVWNKMPIPEDMKLRIFQKNFSTNPQLGRGIGTYSMKFFAEKFLNGKVEFESSEDVGTTFILSLPVI